MDSKTQTKQTKQNSNTLTKQVSEPIMEMVHLDPHHKEEQKMSYFGGYSKNLTWDSDKFSNDFGKWNTDKDWKPIGQMENSKNSTWDSDKFEITNTERIDLEKIIITQNVYDTVRKYNKKCYIDCELDCTPDLPLTRMECMLEDRGEERPPVDLIKTGSCYRILNGRHRIARSLILEHTYIEANVFGAWNMDKNWKPIGQMEKKTPGTLGTPIKLCATIRRQSRLSRNSDMTAHEMAARGIKDEVKVLAPRIEQFNFADFAKNNYMKPLKEMDEVPPRFEARKRQFFNKTQFYKRKANFTGNVLSEEGKNFIKEYNKDKNFDCNADKALQLYLQDYFSITFKNTKYKTLGNKVSVSRVFSAQKGDRKSVV